ncbi:MAG: sensor histidine kinase [Eubacteriales bacterium]|nr:sensor histidine kinase [Eubacteriales bacterium]
MRRARQGRSLNVTLIIGFLICTAVLLVFLACTLVPYISALLSETAVERSKETVLQGVSSVDLYVDSTLSTLHFALARLPADPAEGDEWHGWLDMLVQSHSDVKTLAFFGENGECFYSSGGDVRLSADEIRQSDWFTRAQEYGVTIPCFSRPRVQSLFEDQRSYVVTLSQAAAYTQGGKPRTGVMLMDIDYAALAVLSDAIHLGSSGYAFLVDEQGELIAHPRLQLIYAGLSEENLAAVNSQILGQTSDTLAGRERALIITTLSQTRWRLVGVAYIDELLRSQSAFLRIVTLMMICSAFLALGAASLIAYWVARPITHLEHKMRKVVEGDLNVTISVKGFREIRAVSSAFNHMLRRIRELMEQNERAQEAKRLYELNALQAQINPHFLYNTLNSIIWMEERGRSREAITMVSALAKLFRISISKGRSVITVAEELEHVRNYVIIQKMRFKEKFDCVIEGEDEALLEPTIKLILQPLVENAINHAIDEINGSTLHISVHASVTETELRFVVEDDGVGIPAEQLTGILVRPAGKSGIGLKNVHERIFLTYGEPYGLTIESVEDEGTRVTVRQPRIKGEQA